MRNTVCFGDVHPAQKFIYDGSLFIKTEDYEDVPYNALEVNSGELCGFSDRDEVVMWEGI